MAWLDLIFCSVSQLCPFPHPCKGFPCSMSLAFIFHLEPSLLIVMAQFFSPFSCFLPMLKHWTLGCASKPSAKLTSVKPFLRCAMFPLSSMPFTCFSPCLQYVQPPKTPPSSFWLVLIPPWPCSGWPPPGSATYSL